MAYKLFLWQDFVEDRFGTPELRREIRQPGYTDRILGKVPVLVIEMLNSATTALLTSCLCAGNHS